MKRQLQIVLLPSFDYELFHGRGYLDDETTLFSPTRQMLNAARRKQIPITLFADVCSVSAHRAHGLNEYSNKFEAQLSEAIETGHDVQLHVHAHWNSSSYDGSVWHLREPKVTLSDFGFETNIPRTIISDGVRYLERLLQPRMAGYRCVAFRAGGLALQPDEQQLVRILLDSGIRMDSSVAKGLKIIADTLSIDYTGLPAAANWRISPASGIHTSAQDGIFEIPIATFQMPMAQRFAFLIRRALAFRQQRGAGLALARRQTRWVNLRTLVKRNLRYLTRDPVFMFSADTKGFTRAMLIRGFQQYVSRHSASSDDPIYVSMMSHPKLMFKEQEHLFFDVLEGLRQKYGSHLSLATFSMVADELHLANSAYT